MAIHRQLNSTTLLCFLSFWIFFICFPGLISSAVVSLDSIMIFQTHDLIAKPTVYFACKGESAKFLPDVTKEDVVYSFKGEESWQPLTNLEGKKCKRCGFYEKDNLKSDDVFDEWELCSSDFKSSDGKYIRFKKKEFNATFNCPDCVSLTAAPGKQNDGKGKHVAVVIVISLLVSIIIIIAAVLAYKYWQKKKREQDQARFLKLFEEGDGIEDELGLGTVI